VLFADGAVAARPRAATDRPPPGLGEELLVRMRETIGGSAFASEEMSLDERIGRLIDAGLVTGAQRDEELGSVIASTVVGMAHSRRLAALVRVRVPRDQCQILRCGFLHGIAARGFDE
jgi:hypothetical protein